MVERRPSKPHVWVRFLLPLFMNFFPENQNLLSHDFSIQRRAFQDEDINFDNPQSSLDFRRSSSLYTLTQHKPLVLAKKKPLR